MEGCGSRYVALRALLCSFAGALLSFGSPLTRAQISPEQQNQIRVSIANRIEALTILGADFGLSGGTFTSTGSVLAGQRANEQVNVTKFGGAGDIGDPAPLQGWQVGWQPHVQGSLGTLDSTNELRSPLLNGDLSKFSVEAIEFGGGVRLWLSDSLSIAPTFMGMYAHASNTYSPQSEFARMNFNQLLGLGLIDWRVDTWAVRSGANIQYLAQIDRWILTISSDFAYFHTQAFGSFGGRLPVNGDSGFVTYKVDLDVPLGIKLEGHELRSGGYLAGTDLLGALENGLGVHHVNEIHGRIVLDFANQLWKLKWLGIGGSYLWGSDVNGWTVGADAAFRF